eukprot:10561632-Alexandrium_andersonii.AAC.1
MQWPLVPYPTYQYLVNCLPTSPEGHDTHPAMNTASTCYLTNADVPPSTQQLTMHMRTVGRTMPFSNNH